MVKDKNGKSVVKPMKKSDNDICSDCNYNIKEETVDKKKVKESEVFEKGTKKKVPDGSIMKDKDMKKKKSTPPQKKKTRRPKNY